MSGAQRAIWRGLSIRKLDPDGGEPFTAALCHLCEWATWDHNHSLDCQHDNERIVEQSWEAWAGGDCAGFRPWLRLKRAREIAESGVVWDGVTLVPGPG